MTKLSMLYENYNRENFKEVDKIVTGGTSMKELECFLRSKLSANDYFTAEELLLNAISEKEESSFAAGCRYVSELAMEIFTK